MYESDFRLKLRSALSFCGCSSLASMIVEPIILLYRNDIECCNIEGAYCRFLINTTKPWYLSAPNWVCATPSSGEAGTTEITIKVRSILGVGEQERKSIITIHQGKKTKEIYLYQHQPSQESALCLMAQTGSFSPLYNINTFRGVTVENGEVVAIDLMVLQGEKSIAEIPELSSALTRFTKLRELNLSNCGIKGDINVLLEKLCIYNTELTTLILDNNPFDATTSITADISNLKRLKHLSLNNCNIACSTPNIESKKDKDGAVYTLQSASKGKGVNIVILGDGFIEEEMSHGGFFEELANRAMEAFFCIEPTKSFRDYFNIYMVKAISKKRGTGEKKISAFRSYSRDWAVYGDSSICIEYAQNSPAKDNVHLIITLLNIKESRGVCDLDDKVNIAYSAHYNGNIYAFNHTICHEAIGHGLAELSDEYEGYRGGVNQNWINKQILGANIDITPDRDKIKWHKFLTLNRYKNSVGVFEGGHYHSKDIWRPSQTSIMRDKQSMEFNAPSRYQIVSNIMKLAGEKYSFEEFLEYDKINL